MRLKVLVALVVAVAAWRLGSPGAPLMAAEKAAAATSPSWSVNATAIEACSCPMFCQCYFNSMPAAHHDHGGEAKHYCRANLAYRINKGQYGDVKLDGAKFWLANDLGADFSMGKMDWVVVTYDKATSSEQRAAIRDVVGHLFPGRRGGDHGRGEDGGGPSQALPRHERRAHRDPEPALLGRQASRRLRADAERGRSLPHGPERVRIQGHERLPDHRRHERQGLPRALT
ncbi:MAG: hypothetical protein DMF77_12205 [Acidobacteria bacterium]|nr:MAG: hypothetical protein DMF77_12205 [Acidobacteriota bacterium]